MIAMAVQVSAETFCAINFLPAVQADGPLHAAAPEFLAGKKRRTLDNENLKDAQGGPIPVLKIANFAKKIAEVCFELKFNGFLRARSADCFFGV